MMHDDGRPPQGPSDNPNRIATEAELETARGTLGNLARDYTMLISRDGLMDVPPHLDFVEHGELGNKVQFVANHFAAEPDNPRLGDSQHYALTYYGREQEVPGVEDRFMQRIVVWRFTDEEPLEVDEQVFVLDGRGTEIPDEESLRIKERMREIEEAEGPANPGLETLHRAKRVSREVEQNDDMDSEELEGFNRPTLGQLQLLKKAVGIIRAGPQWPANQN